MGSQDKSESEAHLDTQINPICKVSDTLHTGVRYAADYLVGNYVNPPPLYGAAQVAGEVYRRKTVEGVSKVDRRLA